MKGKLVIGGGNIKKSWREIYGTFTELLPVKRVAVITIASKYPVESFNTVKKIFCETGIKEEDIINIPLSLEEAKETHSEDLFAEESIISSLEKVGGVWFCGGNQRLISSTLLNEDYSDTNILIKIRELLDNGGVIGGSSAGAAIMSKYMITSGTDNGALNYPIREYYEEVEQKFDDYDEPLTYSRGLNFIKNCVIDQHFNKRARLQRLMLTMKHVNESIGYGISEDTAMIVDTETGEIEVKGSAYVTRIELKENGAEIKYIH